MIKHPILCNYYVTYRCNAKCDFCDIWEKPSPYITIESAFENIRDLKKLGVNVIDFTGGEPLLHREIDGLLKIAKRQKMITTLTTNGLLYPKWSKKLLGLVDMLHFSLDAFDGQMHDEMRGVACYDFVIESIKVAKSLGERPDILFTVFESNLEQIEMVYEHICRPNDLVLILNPAFEYNEVNIGKSLNRETLNTILKWGAKPMVYLNEAFIDLRINGGNNTQNPVCKAASTTLVINPANELVLPCYHLGKRKFPINDNLYALYHSHEVQELIKSEGKYAECEGCTINCYMQPSFAVEFNKYWIKSLPSTIKYNRMKGTWKTLLRNYLS